MGLIKFKTSKGFFFFLILTECIHLGDQKQTPAIANKIPAGFCVVIGNLTPKCV